MQYSDVSIHFTNFPVFLVFLLFSVSVVILLSYVHCQFILFICRAAVACKCSLSLPCCFCRITFYGEVVTCLLWQIK